MPVHARSPLVGEVRVVGALPKGQVDGGGLEQVLQEGRDGHRPALVRFCDFVWFAVVWYGLVVLCGCGCGCALWWCVGRGLCVRRSKSNRGLVWPRPISKYPAHLSTATSRRLLLGKLPLLPGPALVQMPALALACMNLLG